MYSAGNNSWTTPILSATVILLATLFVDPLKSFTANPAPSQPPQNQAQIEAPVKTIQTIKDAVLTTTPPTLTLSTGQDKSIVVNIVSPSGKVTGSELHLNYDPDIVSVKEISAGDFLPSPLRLAKQINNQKGEVVYTIGTLQPTGGSGTLAKILITTKDTGITHFSLDSTIVTSENQSENTVKSLKGTTIIVQ